MNTEKPIGRKNYGSIGHLPTSKLGPADHCVSEGQARILTEKTRDKHDVVYVTEKVDGSNVGIARTGNEIHAISRKGWAAMTSPHQMHHDFHHFVELNKKLFLAVLEDGQRLCGEWMGQAHGLFYDKLKTPFIAFDLMVGPDRLPTDELHRICRINGIEHTHLIHKGPAMSVDAMMGLLNPRGFHGCSETPEGLVYRVERNGEFDFAAKWVRHDMECGKFLKMDEKTMNQFIT